MKSRTYFQELLGTTVFKDSSRMKAVVPVMVCGRPPVSAPRMCGVVFVCVLLFLILPGCQSISSSAPGDTVIDCASFFTRDQDLFYGVRDASYTPDDVKAALKKGANVNVADRLGQTILMWACWNGDTGVIDILLKDTKIDVKKTSKKTAPPLSYNALFCFITSPSIGVDETSRDLLNRLIFKNQEVLKQRDSYGENVLHKLGRASGEKRGFIDALPSTFPKDIFEQKNDLGERPLHLAVKTKNKGLVEFLLRQGASVEEETDATLEDSLLGLALQDGKGDTDIFRKLLTAKNDAVKTNASKNKKAGKNSGNFFPLETQLVGRIETLLNTALTPEYDAPLRDFRQAYYECALYAYDQKPNDLPTEEEIARQVADQKDEQIRFLTTIQTAKDSDAATIAKTLQEKKYLADERITEAKNKAILRKPPLQLAIETKRPAIYRAVIDNINPENLSPPADASDYFTIAVIQENHEVMGDILDNYTKDRISNFYVFIKPDTSAGCEAAYTPEKPQFGRLPISATWQRILVTPSIKPVTLEKAVEVYEEVFFNPRNCRTAIRMYVEIQEFSGTTFQMLFDKFQDIFTDSSVISGRISASSNLVEYLRPISGDTETARTRKRIVSGLYAAAGVSLEEDFQAITFANETSLSVGFEFGNTIAHGGAAASGNRYFGSPGMNLGGYSFWNGGTFGMFFHGACMFPVLGDDAYDFQGALLIGPAFRVRFSDKLTLQTGIGIGGSGLSARYEESGVDYYGSALFLALGSDAGLQFDITDKFFIKGGMNVAWSFLGWANIREKSSWDWKDWSRQSDYWTLNANPYISFGVTMRSPKREISRPEGQPSFEEPLLEETTPDTTILDYKDKKKKAPVPAWAVPLPADKAVAAAPEFVGKFAYPRYETGEKLEALEKKYAKSGFQKEYPRMLSDDLFQSIPNRDSDPFAKKVIGVLEKQPFKDVGTTDFWQKVQIPGPGSKPEFRYWMVYTVERGKLAKYLAGITKKIEKIKAKTEEENEVKTLALQALNRLSATL